jgi:hypothetical protein
MQLLRSPAGWTDLCEAETTHSSTHPRIEQLRAGADVEAVGCRIAYLDTSLQHRPGRYLLGLSRTICCC